MCIRDSQYAFGGGDVEVLDHPAAVRDDAGSRGRLPSVEQAACVLDRLGARRVRRVGVVDLLRVDERLAVEAQCASLTALGEVAVRVGEVVVCLLYTSPSPRDRTRYRMPS